MTTPRTKTEDKKITARKGSISEEVNLKDILKELQGIAENQKTFQDQLTTLKKDLAEEFTEIKKEMKGLQEDIKGMKEDNQKLGKAQDNLKTKLEKLEVKSAKLEERQERLERRELEFQVRIRNIVEEPGENVKQIVTQILADLLQTQDEEMEENIERAFRVTTNFSKKNNVARDVVVHFERRKIREEVLRLSKKNTIRFKGLKVTILREYPTSTMQKRRKYLFLTEELKKRHIRFRWERREGIMATYKQEQHWITTEDKAKDFYKLLMKEKTKPNPNISPSEEELERDKKRARAISPENHSIKPVVHLPNLIDLEEKESKED
nr:PREDICTED: coiled-coil domain-containing protein 39-like [Anolis carolinensis]|eukprot:XP_016847488.1 PREDICTED: coiled-coil domain-containing protein 39-like [Anolis carolinensis]